MADVEVTYNNNTIVELSESGIKTLKTAGKYCEDDIVLEYEKPEVPDPTTSINFYDYDGTLVGQWSLTELQSKTALPECPTHTGLTSQGWNWSLSDLKSINRAMNVGALYVPTDGKTHVFIDLTKVAASKCAIPLNFVQTDSSGVTVDWGDGSATQTKSSTGEVTMTHTYSTADNYDITLDVTSGTMSLGGSGDGGNSGSAKPFLSSSKQDTAAPQVCYEVWIGDSVPTIGNNAFRFERALKKITIPRGVTSAGVSSFESAVSLEAVIFPDGMTSLGATSMQYTALKCLSLPNSLTSIGNSAFQYASFPELFLGEQITSINSTAFNSNPELKYAYIPGSAQTIGASAFANCHDLLRIDLSEGITEIGGYAFSNCSKLESITIPSTVTTLGAYAMQNCYLLKSVDIRGTISSSTAATYTFTNDVRLKEITLPVVYIGSYYLNYCCGLETVTFTSDVTSITTRCLSGCNNLKNLYFEGTTPPSVLSSTAFSELPRYCVIHVPAGYLATYKSATNYPSSSTYTYVEETA